MAKHDETVLFDDGLERTFEQWRKLLDATVRRLTGLGVDDLPDCRYHDWWSDGMSYETAARKTIRMAQTGGSE